MSTPDRPGRGGISIDERGKQATVGGWWPEELDKYQKGSLIARQRDVWAKTMAGAQRLHTQNEAVRLARAQNKTPEIPSAEVRQQLAKRDAQTIAKLRDEFVANELEAHTRKQSHKPFKYDPDFTDAMHRQEMRAFLRGRDNKARTELVRKPAFRRAALEVEPELSGLSPEQYARYFEGSVRERYPDQMRELDDHDRAHEMAELVLKATEAALHNEFKASGTTEKADPPTAPVPWVPIET
jgi:hypothetical protein